MASYIDWYLIELERRVTGRMPAEGVFSFLSEVEDHLRLKSADLVAAGMDANRAEKVATESFGEVNDLAIEAVARLAPQRMARGRIYVTLAVSFVWAAAATLAFCGFIPELVIGVFGLTLVAAAFFFVGSAIATKFLGRPIVALGVAGTIAITALMPFGFGQVGRVLESKYWVKNDLMNESLFEQDLSGSVSRLKAGVAFYRQLDKVHGDLTKVTLTAPKAKDGRFMLPDRSVYMGGYNGYDYPNMMAYGYWQATSDLTQAKTAWLRDGVMILDEESREQSGIERRITDLEAARQRPVAFSSAYLEGGMSIGIGLSALILGLNALTVGLARVARRRRISRPIVA